MNFIIVGCGGLGSTLSYHLMKKVSNIKNIILVDSDIIENDNIICGKYISDFPLYLRNQPKSLLIEYMMNNKNVNTRTKNKKFLKNKIKEYRDYIKIDCSDNIEVSNMFNYKLNIDGHYGLIISNPENNTENLDTYYRYGRSLEYTEKFSNIFLEIFNNKTIYNNKMIINLITGEIIDVTNINRRFLCTGIITN